MPPVATTSGESKLAVFVAVLSLGCATSASAPPAAQQSRLGPHEEADAILRAEQFVRVNGYVGRQDADPTRVVRESCCADGGEIGPILDGRAGTLLGAACAVMHENVKAEEPGWTVVFCYDPRNKEYREAVPDFPRSVRDRGRAVVMDLGRTNLRIVHQDFSLQAKGLKPLPGMAVFEEMLRKEAAEPGVAGGPGPRLRSEPGR